MIERRKIMDLVNIISKIPVISSLYLDLTGGTKKFRPALRNLIRDERERLLSETGSSDYLLSIIEPDLQRIQKYVEGLNRQRGSQKGLAVFSCTESGLWEVFSLPKPVENALFVSHRPQLRPIIHMMDSYRRIVTVFLSKDKARVFEYFMGDLKEQTSISSEVPDRVKKAGFYGRDERGIERHIKDHIRGHLKTVAEVLETLNRKNSFHWLIIGSNPELSEELEELLSWEIKRKIKSIIPVEMDMKKTDLHKKLQQVEKELKEKEDRELVNELLESFGPRGLGVSGVNETLYCLYQGDAQILLVEEGFSIGGGVCPHCDFLGVGMEKCPMCSRDLIFVKDVISDAMSLAVKKNCQVVEVHEDCGLERAGRIGAILRYKR